MNLSKIFISYPEGIGIIIPSNIPDSIRVNICYTIESMAIMSGFYWNNDPETRKDNWFSSLARRIDLDSKGLSCSVRDYPLYNKKLISVGEFFSLVL